MKYTPAQREILFKKVIENLQNGKPLGQVLDMEGMPSRTAFYAWCDEDKSKSERYVRAKEIAAAALFDRLIQIAETPMEGQTVEDSPSGVKIVTGDMLGHRRLLIDTIKWRLAKERPDKYGDKLDVTSGNKALAVPAIVGMVIQNEVTKTDEPNDDML
jgi:hypothetical protein